jgi:hypothetical protein
MAMINVNNMHTPGRFQDVTPVLYRGQLGCISLSSYCCVNALSRSGGEWQLSTRSVGPVVRQPELEKLIAGETVMVDFMDKKFPIIPLSVEQAEQYVREHQVARKAK